MAAQLNGKRRLKQERSQKVYCIAGLGADEQVFQFLDLSFTKPVFIPWIKPLPGDTLASYAGRLREQFIPESNPIIIGLSLGGMLATEIAKTLPHARAIIISSAKTGSELPARLKLLRYLPLYKLLTPALVKYTRKTQAFYLGVHTPQARNYLYGKLKTVDVPFYKWAIGAIVHWPNNTVTSNIIHIHGRADRLLPYKFVQPHITVERGGHLMIVEEAATISGIIKNILHPEAPAGAPG